MTVKDLAATIDHNKADLFINFNGDEIIYSAPLACAVDNLIIDKVEADGQNHITAYIKLIPAKKRGLTATPTKAHGQPKTNQPTPGSCSSIIADTRHKINI